MILIVADRQTFYSYDKDGIEQVGGFEVDWTWREQYAFQCTIYGRWFGANSVEGIVAYLRELGFKVRVMGGAEFRAYRMAFEMAEGVLV